MSKSIVNVSLIRTGAKCETGPWYSRPKILAKNRVDSSLSRAGTIVWSRTMVKSASSQQSSIKMSPIAAIGKHHPLRLRGYPHTDRERGLVTSVCRRRNRSRYSTEPATMNLHADRVTEWPVKALTVVLAGLVLRGGAPSHAQTTDQA